MAIVSRGNRGAAIVNVSAESLPVSLPTTLKSGKYTDAVSGSRFTVKKGILTGTVNPLTSYILMAK